MGGHSSSRLTPAVTADIPPSNHERDLSHNKDPRCQKGCVESSAARYFNTRRAPSNLKEADSSLYLSLVLIFGGAVLQELAVEKKSNCIFYLMKNTFKHGKLLIIDNDDQK